MKKLILLLAAAISLGGLRAQDRHVALWDNTTAPTSNGLAGEEIEYKPGQWKNIQKAEMWIYKAGANPTGQAVVIFPGGGYSKLSVGNGHTTAKWFAANGITAAVVKYRMPNGHPTDRRRTGSPAGDVFTDPRAGIRSREGGGGPQAVTSQAAWVPSSKSVRHLWC